MLTFLRCRVKHSFLNSFYFLLGVILQHLSKELRDDKQHFLMTYVLISTQGRFSHQENNSSLRHKYFLTLKSTVTVATLRKFDKYVESQDPFLDLKVHLLIDISLALMKLLFFWTLGKRNKPRHHTYTSHKKKHHTNTNPTLGEKNRHLLFYTGTG